MIYVLVGIGRSGTSLLQSIIFHQEGIRVYPETQFFRRFLIANDTSQREFTSKEIDEILRKENPRYKNLSTYLDLHNLGKDRYSFRQITNLFCEGEESVLFKDARDLDYLKEISSALSPDPVEVICTVRDLRDVILSRMKAAFSKRWGFLLNLVIMRFQYTSLLKYEKHNNVYLIRYEDFTRGDFKSLKDVGIINRGLDGIDLRNIAEVLFSEEELSAHKEKNRKSVDGSNTRKWEGKLSKSVVFLIELMFDDYFRRFGYRRSFSSKILSAVNSFVRVAFIILHPFYYRISVYRDQKRYGI